MNDATGTGLADGGLIRPCLIGESRDKFVPSGPVGLLPASSVGVPRFNPYVAPDGSVSSLDMVRLRLKFAGNDAYVARLEDRVQRLDSLTNSWNKRRSAPGQYAHLHTLEYGDSVVAFGVGQFVRGVKADMRRGFIEFNPNKVGGGDGLLDFLRLVGSRVERCELVRYDLAVDLPVARSRVRVRKDRRKYAFEQGDALTEYLGRRNADGYVKVYDKAAELGVRDMDLTRVEMTCKGSWSVAQVLEKWPTVYRVADVDGAASDTNAVLAMMAAELVDGGGSPEKYLAILDKRRRAKVRNLLEGVTYPCPMQGAVHVLFEAMAWTNRLTTHNDS